jgi:FkbM family methyltransferase
MNYAYIFVDNLNGHSYKNGLDELRASISTLKKNQIYNTIQIFNNEFDGKNVEYFGVEKIVHNHFNISRNYGGSNNINPINILVEKIIQLMNFDENQDIVLMDIDTSSQKTIPKDFFNSNYIVFDTVEYPIMQWRNLDKVLPQIPWKDFDVNFDSSFMMYNTGVIYIPKKFRKELCEKALKLVDYMNYNFDPSERCGNKLDEQIALSIVCHDAYGRFGNIKYSSDYIHHHWEDRQKGIEWWKKIIVEDRFNDFIESHYQTCVKQVNQIKSILEKKVIIDVGSNIGLFSKAIVENVDYEHIYLFEPSIEYFNKSKEILKSFSNITYNNCGLDLCNKKLTLFKDNKNIGWNTIYTKDPMQSETFYKKMVSEEINVVKLDDYYKDIEDVGFIKIDVEGYERNVLEGSWDIIKKFKPYILIEVSWGTNHPDWELNKNTYEKLFSLGYEKVDFSNHTEDILFKPIINVNKLPISIGILSWKSNQTLRNTLNSYQRNGLFDIVDNVVLFFQEISEEDRILAKEYNLPYISTEENIGIGGAFIKLAEVLKEENILLLEHDWELTEDIKTTFLQLKQGVELLDKDYNCIRLRSVENPGHPLYSQNVYEGNELNHYDPSIDLISPHLFECRHWIQNVDEVFPDKIKKENNYFTTTSRWSNFTNNPCLYKKDFYISSIRPFEKKGSLYDGLELNVSHWWGRQDFKIAWGKGIFTHNDIEKYGPNTTV